MQDTVRKLWNTRGLFAVAILVGLLCGVAAWGFRLLIGLVHNVAFFGQFSFDYDANLHTAESAWGWLVVLVPVLGGIAVIWLVKNFAPEAKGHGVPEVMDAIFHKRGRIRGEVSIVKTLASGITIGTGGSLGREGPIVMICSAFSSVLAQWLNMPMSQRNLLIACGASGGIAATFNAPLGGILFSIELLLLSVNSTTVMPVIISSVIAANTGRYLIGPEPAFHIPTGMMHAVGESPLMLAIYFPFAAIVGLVAVVFVKSIYWSEQWFDNLPVGPYQRHMIGMLALGVLMLGMYETFGHYYIQGVGYATIQDLVSGNMTSAWFIALLVVVKLIAVLLTIGSGGSGGVFSPSLYLGATLGGAFGYGLAALFPSIGVDAPAFALVGMAAMVAATTSAPLTAAIMTYEMTLDYVVVLPIMVGVAVAYAVRRHFSEGDIYTLKLIRRGRSVPHGRHSDINSHLMINEIMNKQFEFVKSDAVVDAGDGTRSMVVVDDDNKVIGLINPISSRTGIQYRAGDVMLTEFIPIRSGLSLREAFYEIDRHSRVVAVVTRDGSTDADKVVGVLSPFDLTRAMANASQLHLH
ncbi:MAG: chloride channel protein [Chromatiaceae bacterium]|nr:chloride channel protein [Gammaproteobacteria bacterium]MCP5422413.1 chloride channel protein [Chromatiaceae bacterium]